MLTIQCCKDCVPPKRYPGCGAKCKEYKEERRKLDEENEMKRAKENLDIIKYERDKVKKFHDYKAKQKRRG